MNPTSAPTDTSLYTERVECSCKECGKNAAKIGKSLPLAAMVRPEYVAKFGSTKKAAHQAVWTANHPMLGGAQSLAVPVA